MLRLLILLVLFFGMVEISTKLTSIITILESAH